MQRGRRGNNEQNGVKKTRWEQEMQLKQAEITNAKENSMKLAEGVEKAGETLKNVLFSMPLESAEMPCFSIYGKSVHHIWY
jgi:hypothetical protein